MPKKPLTNYRKPPPINRKSIAKVANSPTTKKTASKPLMKKTTGKPSLGTIKPKVAKKTASNPSLAPVKRKMETYKSPAIKKLYESMEPAKKKAMERKVSRYS